MSYFDNLYDYIRLNSRLEALQQERFGEDDIVLLLLKSDLSRKSDRKNIRKAKEASDILSDKIQHTEKKLDILEYKLLHPFKSEGMSDDEIYDKVWTEPDEEELQAKNTSHEESYMD